MSISTSFEPTDGGLVLTDAILLYRTAMRDDANRYTMSVPRGDTFASIHAVEHGDGQPTIAAGAPLTRAHLRQWTEALGRKVAPEILPGNVLVAHPDILAWWVPAKLRTSYFDLTKPPAGVQALAQRTVLQLPFPAHLFVATRGRLCVYALAVSERPTADTILLHSPVLNVYIDGSLCWGNIPRPKSIVPASMPDYERAVFDSWSTHPNVGQEDTVTGKGGLVRLWDRVAASKATRFPIRRMRPFVHCDGRKADRQPMTLGALIQRSTRK